VRRFSALAALALLVEPALVLAQDCNGNGIDDGADVQPGQLRLGSPWIFPVDEEPVGLVLEDLDGDGLADVALARAFGVTIYRNGGDGPFRRARNLVLGSNPVAIAAADLDSNGALDIVTANTIDASQIASNISVNLNRGGGEFAVARNFFVSSVPGPIVCSDLDGDGSRDIAVATRKAAVSVLWNSGTGRFDTSTDNPAPAFSRGMDAGDVDGDGDDDIVCALESVPSRFLLLRNLGGRRLESETPLPPPDGDPFSAALSDLDGDGDLDLSAMMRFAGEPQGEIALFWNDGRGVFSARPSLASGRFVAAAAADLDADGVGDVIAVEDGEHVEIWSGMGGGEFRHRAHKFRNSEFDVLLAVGDLDATGTRDLAVAGLDDRQVHLLRSDGRGGLEIPVKLGGEGPGTVVDLDADGDPDVLASEAGRVLVLENHGELRFEERRSLWLGAKPGGTAASDVDGDGDLDALVSSSRRDVFRLGLAVLMNDGTGELGSAEPYGEHLDIRRMQPADIDRDGDPDIVADVEGSPSVFILENDGSGRFQSPVEVPMAARHEIATIVVDLDADGRLDLVSVPSLPKVPGEPRDLALVARWGDGRGGFEEALRYSLAGLSSVPVPGDWDGDGILDLALASAPACAGCPGTVSNFIGLGDRSFYVVSALEGPDGSSAFAGADLNGDGALDVVGADARTGSIFISVNGGAGRFENPVVLEIGASPKAMAIHDLDADGDLDVMTLNRSLGVGAEICPSCTETIGKDLTIIRNMGDGRFFAPLHQAGIGIDDGLSLQAIDLEGDRLPELVVVDQNGYLVLVGNSTPPATSADGDRDARPDECESTFHRGDANGDGALDLADPIHILAHLFLSGDPPGCLETVDADDDGEIDLTDAVRLLAHLFLSGPPPEYPGPPGAPCGPDPGLPGGAGDLGCATYTPCERVAR